MRHKRLLFATLLISLLGSVGLAQTGRDGAQDAIRRGNEKYSKAQYALAIDEFGRVSPDAGETYAKSLYNIGVCYYELWKTEEAIVYYRRAVEARQGRYPMALHALGVALRDLGKFREAKEAFRQSIAAAGGNYAPAHYMLGVLVMGEANHEAAAASFREAIARSKERFPAGHNNLGVVLARMGRLPEAEREFETALRQSDGEFDEATQNLRLCRSLLTLSQLTALKTVDTSVRRLE